MSDFSKVIWSEGILLSQQHFQQWDRYYETYLKEQMRDCFPLKVGLIDLAIDEAQLKTGRFVIKHCQAILPNGRYINFHRRWEWQCPPYLMEVGAGEMETLYLTIPSNDKATPLSGYPEPQGETCWYVQSVKVEDKHDPMRSREIMLGEMRASIKNHKGIQGDKIALRLATLKNAGSAGYKMVAEDIPPLVCVQASSFLIEQLAKMVATLQVKLNMMSEKGLGLNTHQISFGRKALQEALCYQALHRVLPDLQHIHQQAKAYHPVELYRVLISLISDLRALCYSKDLAPLPDYHHENLGETFMSLSHLLSFLIEGAVSEETLILHFDKVSETEYQLKEIDSSHLEKPLFLAVQYASSDLRWADKFSKQVKLGSVEDMPAIIAAALPGVNVVPIVNFPNQIVKKDGYEYFQINKKNEFWKSIHEARNISLFVPSLFDSAKFELIPLEILKENK